MDPHIRHSLGFADAWARSRPRSAPERSADLGSGGGVPSLVLATVWPDMTLYLIESMQRRAVFLRRAVETLNLEHVTVIQARAEEIGRDPVFRGTFDLVTARGFGPPAVTAECGAPLLRAGGWLVVSDPPDSGPERWPAPALEPLGLGPAGTGSPGPRLAVMRQVSPCPPRYPRRPGMPAKRPLF